MIEIDRSILSGLGVIGDDVDIPASSLPSLPLGAVRVAEVDVVVPVLGRRHVITVKRIVSTLPPAGSQTRFH